MDFDDSVRYYVWRLELWSRNYGSYNDIDRDVDAGKLIPGTMPGGYERPGDSWRPQAEVERPIRTESPRRT